MSLFTAYNSICVSCLLIVTNIISSLLLHFKLNKIELNSPTMILNRKKQWKMFWQCFGTSVYFVVDAVFLFVQVNFNAGSFIYRMSQFFFLGSLIDTSVVYLIIDSNLRKSIYRKIRKIIYKCTNKTPVVHFVA